ncbi:solute carrier family 15 member 1b isoform X1 [Gambusia affinis]|uniref:solute carrier family 15 member 1b isoform X1 n=1 Tax=Gambusia affinis TaxID=33528 RepID=UPI001CDBB687|nr:solute carrier family 15 member 1b isoform X1 [Gambusia affinis]
MKDSQSHSCCSFSADKEKKMGKKKSQVTIFGYPLSIFFIVVNEFCERFSYYGMRAVLVLYFKYFLKWDDDFSTTIYHTFVALCYLSPILGAIIADSWLGKFKTIVYLSIVYAAGQVIMAVSAIHDITDGNKDGTPDNMTFHIALSMVGLLLIALGTGGIKPCVAAFGGDQFSEDQDKQRSTFFSIFYLSINAGSLLSTVITPILRAQKCGIQTQQQCYSLAFGVPAALMVVALIVFIVGSGMYNKTAPSGNIMVKVCRCIFFAIGNRFRNRSSQIPKRKHWLDWAEEKYDKLLIAQVKMVLKVLFLYIPLPMFWALFDQQGSRWTLQATTMNGNFGLMVIQPDQMQTVNPILILIMVPVMDFIIYPLISKCKLNFTPLRRMTVGMFLAALAFVAAALVQLQIDATLPNFPSRTEQQAKFINMVDRPINILAGEHQFPLQAFQGNEDYHTFDLSFDLTIDHGSPNLIHLPKGTRSTIVIVEEAGIMTTMQFGDVLAKPDEGANAIRFFNGLGIDLNITVGQKSFGNVGSKNMSKYVDVPQGTAEFLIKNATGNTCVYSQELGFGSSYTLIIPPTLKLEENCGQNITKVADIKANSIHMAWQIPQYFLMTSGEVVFSVTGLEFSYSQAPSNMKSVLQAGWLLTVAVGNIIVLIVAEAATLRDQWAEYILFAALLVSVCIVFAIKAYFYEYIDPVKIEADFTNLEPEDEKKKNFEMTKKDMVEHHNEKRRRSSNSSFDKDKTPQTNF